jgi:hypothetical protein
MLRLSGTKPPKVLLPAFRKFVCGIRSMKATLLTRTTAGDYLKSMKRGLNGIVIVRSGRTTSRKTIKISTAIASSRK